MRTRRKNKVKDEAMPESVAPKVSAAPAVKQDWGPTAVQRDNRDAILDRARDYKGKNPTADGGPQALAGLGSSGFVKMADKMVKNVTSPNKPQPSAPTSVYDPKNSLGVAEKLPTVDQSNYEAARLRAQTEAMRANTAQQTLQTSLIQSRGAETPFNALGLQQQGINPQAAQGAGVNVDYTGYVQNYPVPQAIQQANAVYGQHLAGAPIMPPPPPVDPNAQAVPMTATPQMIQQASTAWGALSPEQQATFNQQFPGRPDHLTPEAWAKGQQRQRERRAEGQQRRADSRDARLRGTTPEIEANRRAMQQEADAQREAEMEGVRREARVDGMKTALTSMQDQLTSISRMLDAEVRSQANLEGEALAASRERQQGLQQQAATVRQSMSDLNNQLTAAHVPPEAVMMLMKKKGDPKAVELFDATYGKRARSYLLGR